MKKKAIIMSAFLIWTIILLVAFSLIAAIITKFVGIAGGRTAEEICRGSVALQDKSTFEFGHSILGGAEKDKPFPLLCKTLKKELPLSGRNTEIQLMHDLAEISTRCWWQFREATYDDVFSGKGYSFGGKDECFVCYTITTGDNMKKIEAEPFVNYLSDTPKLVKEEGDLCSMQGGKCTANKKECTDLLNDNYFRYDRDNTACNEHNTDEAQKGCCISDLECQNYGGYCDDETDDEYEYDNPKDSEDPRNDKQYLRYDGWECNSVTECYVEKDNYYSYLDYVQFYGGKGSIKLLTELEENQVYAVAYGDPTKKCAWCENPILTGALGGGVGTVIGAGVVLGIIALIPGGQAVSIVGFTAILTGAQVGGGIGAYMGMATANEAGDIAEFIGSVITDRHHPTLYIGKLSDIQNKCQIVKDTGGQ